MARKEIIIDIQDREQLLTFKIREMPASRLERWIARIILLLAGSGVNLPSVDDIGAAGEFVMENGLSALASVDFEKAEPLLDELLGCCSRVIERVEERCTPQSVDAYILDVTTLLKLRMEALKLNLSFLLPEGASLSGSPEKTATAVQ